MGRKKWPHFRSFSPLLPSWGLGNAVFARGMERSDLACRPSASGLDVSSPNSPGLAVRQAQALSEVEREPVETAGSPKGGRGNGQQPELRGEGRDCMESVWRRVNPSNHSAPWVDAGEVDRVCCVERRQ